MSSFYGKAFDEAAWHLRREFREDRIRIQTVKSEVLTRHHSEHTCGDATAYRIRVARGMSEQRAIETLVHEYAHALHFRHNPTAREYHSDEWGKFYARCYRAVYGD